MALNSHHADAPALVALAEAIAGQLQALLEAEFEELKVSRLDALEEHQSRKTDLLEQLAQVVPPSLGSASDVPPGWAAFAERMQLCKDLHRRNEILVQRRLEAVRGAISALQISGEGLIEETYDRSGRLSWGTGLRRARSAYGA
jgi:flagellar biosynthesis/type III secretory pathway chaperone